MGKNGEEEKGQEQDGEVHGGGERDVRKTGIRKVSHKLDLKEP